MIAVAAAPGLSALFRWARALKVRIGSADLVTRAVTVEPFPARPTRADRGKAGRPASTGVWPVCAEAGPVARMATTATRLPSVSEIGHSADGLPAQESPPIVVLLWPELQLWFP